MKICLYHSHSALNSQFIITESPIIKTQINNALLERREKLHEFRGCRLKLESNFKQLSKGVCSNFLSLCLFFFCKEHTVADKIWVIHSIAIHQETAESTRHDEGISVNKWTRNMNGTVLNLKNDPETHSPSVPTSPREIQT